MKKFSLSAFAVAVAGCSLYAQTNTISTNPVAEQVMLGNYTPSTYMPSVVVDIPATIAQELNARISPDSLHAYLEGLRAFQNRNTGSDTVSSTKGIGAARRWIYSRFQDFSARNENRLLVSYLQFDLNVCNMMQHKNVFAVLPGSDITDKSIIIIEAHMDSRCDDGCDTACLAEGMEDNGSGTALVMELARVMSKYSFKRTIVFMTTTGEEQGLVGADAFAKYAKSKGIKIRAVQNNDITGGIVCGHTASPPGCPGLNDIDSTHVRLFSQGGFNSPNKQLARFIKLEYLEMAASSAAVPMGIHIMSAEDRTGRGGDHIPFRQQGFAAIRLTSANEHGDGNPTPSAYQDRQHTSDDILGVDTDADMQLDSFFVDFNYLARNAVINGNAATMAAVGPETPGFYITSPSKNEIKVHITSQEQSPAFRAAVRINNNNDWDTVYTFTGTTFTFGAIPDSAYAISVAAVDNKGIESLFSEELMMNTVVESISETNGGVELLQNKPNPFDEKTIISVLVSKELQYKKAFITIMDIAGKEVKRLPVTLKEGINEVLYEHGYNASGSFIYTLVIDGRPIESKRMIFAN